jgi:hypothetical protein
MLRRLFVTVLPISISLIPSDITPSLFRRDPVMVDPTFKKSLITSETKGVIRKLKNGNYTIGYIYPRDQYVDFP